jgi:hypothetical protein
VLLVLFTAAAAYEALHLSAITGTDAWLHLRTGLWILQDKGVPRTGVFTQYSDSPWVAHSWVFDVVVAAVYRIIDLRALPVLLMIYKAALGLAFFLLARGLRSNFWPAVLLSAIAQFVLWDAQLDPILNSILLLAIELAILFRARQTGNVRQLVWLPALFIAWVNLDIRFVYGLVVVLIFLAARVVEAICGRFNISWFEDDRHNLSLTPTAGIVAGCFIATLISPYGLGIYNGTSVLFGGSNLEEYLHELTSLAFRRPQDSVVLLLAMVAFFVLGRLHLRNLFAVGLMIFGTTVSISIRSEAWLVLVISIAVLANVRFWRAGASVARFGVSDWSPRTLGVIGIAAVVVLAIAAARIPGRDALLSKMSKTLPLKACDYIRDHHLPAPLFNNYEWGGFIAWYLPEYPVSIDSRNDLYGDDVNLRYFKITHGEAPMGSELHFAYAGTTIVPIDSPVAAGMAAGPRFTPVYHDDVALVLERTALLKGE